MVKNFTKTVIYPNRANDVIFYYRGPACSILIDIVILIIAIVIIWLPFYSTEKTDENLNTAVTLFIIMIFGVMFLTKSWIEVKLDDTKLSLKKFYKKKSNPIRRYKRY